MKPLTRISITLLSSMLSWFLMVFSGASFGRLNTPDSKAAISDYLLWCGLPLAGGMAAGIVSRFVGFIGKVAPAPVAGEAPKASQTVAILGKEMGRLGALGQTAHARELLEAIEKVKQ